MRNAISLSATIGLIGMAMPDPAPAMDDLVDIVASRPCSSIAGDWIGAAGNCSTTVSGKELAVKLEAASGSATFRLPPSVILPGNRTDQDSVVSVDGLMLYKGSLTPEVWRLNAGDILKVKLTNKLPSGENAATNLHTHGLLVSPDLDVMADGRASEPVGDTVYVCTLPVGDRIDGPSAQHCSSHGSRYGASTSEMNYELGLPKDHPDGLFWYHPHVHMNARVQVGSGLSGLIYIKGTDPKVSGGARSTTGVAPVERLMMLKDIQFGAIDSTDPKNIKVSFLPVGLHDAGLCGTPAAGARPWEGACFAKDGDGKDVGWLFTLNGQVFPHVGIEPGTKEIWRIANTSADMTYDLALVEEGTGRPLRVQVLARDGVAATPEGGSGVILTERILLMPGSRIEIGVDRGTAEGLFSETTELRARLRSYGFFTGGAADFGDAWPAFDLAEVVFKGAETSPVATQPMAAGTTLREGRNARLAAKTKTPDAFTPLVVTPWTPNPAAEKVPVPSRANRVGVRPAEHTMSMHMGSDLHPSPPVSGSSNRDCKPLAAGEERVISLAIEKDPDRNVELFKIGAARGIRQDAAGWNAAVTNATGSARAFGQNSVVLCGHAGRSEHWTIVNQPKILPDGSFDPKGNNETHNFHIHQMKFEVEEVVDPTGRITAPLGGSKAKRKVDSFPVPIGGSLRIKITYTKQQVGRFVFHCHILEHEDKGMMAEIEVMRK
jgi:FtsP/CotA-like multicopper oxidase with cupredoxin domain